MSTNSVDLLQEETRFGLVWLFCETKVRVAPFLTIMNDKAPKNCENATNWWGLDVVQFSPSKPGSMEDAIKLWLKVFIKHDMDKSGWYRFLAFAIWSKQLTLCCYDRTSRVLRVQLWDLSPCAHWLQPRVLPYRTRSQYTYYYGRREHAQQVYGVLISNPIFSMLAQIGNVEKLQQAVLDGYGWFLKDHSSR